jgi:hypothetical protein
MTDSQTITLRVLHAIALREDGWAPGYIGWPEDRRGQRELAARLGHLRRDGLAMLVDGTWYATSKGVAVLLVMNFGEGLPPTACAMARKRESAARRAARG